MFIVWFCDIFLLLEFENESLLFVIEVMEVFILFLCLVDDIFFVVDDSFFVVDDKDCVIGDRVV